MDIQVENVKRRSDVRKYRQTDREKIKRHSYWISEDKNINSEEKDQKCLQELKKVHNLKAKKLKNLVSF